MGYLRAATFNGKSGIPARSGHDGLPPIDVRGYYHWNLTDDFEWQWGYFSRYGLIAIDYDHNLERVPRTSAEVYRGEIEARGEDRDE